MTIEPSELEKRIASALESAINAGYKPEDVAKAGTDGYFQMIIISPDRIEMCYAHKWSELERINRCDMLFT